MFELVGAYLFPLFENYSSGAFMAGRIFVEVMRHDMHIKPARYIIYK